MGALSGRAGCRFVVVRSTLNLFDIIVSALRLRYERKG